MILTVTPNPAIDRVLFVRDFCMQDMVRAEREAVAPSGKGIDVSAILHTFGVETLALALNAGLSGAMMTGLLDEMGVPYSFIPANGYTRMAALITDMESGRQSTIIAPTLTAEPAHLDVLLERAADAMSRCWGLVCAGSLPPGLPGDAYPQLFSLAKQEPSGREVITLLDSSGESLRQGATAVPHILKVNLRELAALAPETFSLWPEDSDPDDALIPASRLAGYLAERLGEWATQAIVITLGKRGALAVTEDGRWYAPAVTVPVVSPAGAGDAASAGLMLARHQGEGWRGALALGVAMAAAVVMNPGTCECHPYQVEELLPMVETIDV